MTRRVKNKQTNKTTKSKPFCKCFTLGGIPCIFIFRFVASVAVERMERGVKRMGGAWPQSTYINLWYRRVALGAGAGGVSGKSPNCTFSSGKAYAQISCC